uniref:Uncharacterized protein n=1 Tax=Pyxicephalus adspersus TaxID=30357 RepID=A0AAV3AIS1_PYXAD|nr:TPA: hypothetical protein GDO54_011423 [Pyxicephalus adspersus]
MWRMSPGLQNVSLEMAHFGKIARSGLCPETIKKPSEQNDFKLHNMIKCRTRLPYEPLIQTQIPCEPNLTSVLQQCSSFNR